MVRQHLGSIFIALAIIIAAIILALSTRYSEGNNAVFDRLTGTLYIHAADGTIIAEKWVK